MDSVWLWAAMALYGVVMFVASPRTKDFGGFFSGRNQSGGEVGVGLLVGSVVISWLFAKSITNAANLGASFGFVGALAYAGWYLSIPVAGVVIYALRTRLGVKSLAQFITHKYGVMATLGFTLVIMVRLFNEIWSNTAVVGAYFGEAGSTGYYSAALVFAGLTLAYSLRGGMRSSILTDAIQFAFGLFLLVFVLALIVPKSGMANLVAAGEWTLVGGLDLLLVAVVQSLSYAFHDPVLTDRAFINRPAQMLKGYLIAGLVAGLFIVLFGLVGVHGALSGIDVGQDAPLRVAQAFGLGATAVMSVLMMISAGSTIDSSLSSFSKVAVTDLGGHGEDGKTHTVFGALTAWIEKVGPLNVGRATMVVTVILGSLPLFAGTAILKATTISGTMVLGLAPVFLLFGWKAAGRLAFHFAFWPGVALGFWFAFGTIPEVLHIGDGKYAGLLGINVYGTLVIFVLFVLGAALDTLSTRGKAAILVGFFGLIPSVQAEEPPAEDPEPVVSFSGQTMLRLTTNMADLSRPTSEVYNVRLVGKVALEPFEFLVEPRLRQTNLRSFSPSNIWLQQAYASWLAVPGLRVSGGLLYNQLGLFWDDSWFGNIPYLNGHKLDPDMNLEVAYSSTWGRLGLDSWLQFSPSEDGQDGQFATVEKARRVLLPTDLEVQPNFREALAIRARVVPNLQLGPIKIAPGGSFQYSVYDRTEAPDPVVTGNQFVWDAELTLTIGPVSLAGEYLDETVSGFTDEDLRRTYVLGKLNWTVFDRDTKWFKKLDLGNSFQTADYRPEGFDEWMMTVHIMLRLHELIGLTTEYVREELSDTQSPELDRIEWILHIYY
jgi:Na+/proline symporter